MRYSRSPVSTRIHGFGHRIQPTPAVIGTPSFSNAGANQKTLSAKTQFRLISQWF
jgi:hypothetical protein